MKNLQGKTVVITGAGSGMGRELAIQLDEIGAILALTDYKNDILEETKGMLKNPEKHSYHIFDVADKEAFQKFTDEAISHHKMIDVVINNAGIALDTASVQKLEWDAFEKIVGINMWGMIYGSKMFLQHLKSRPEACIVNLSSVFGLIGVAHQAAYSTTKFAIRGFTESLKLELSKTNVVALSVHPGGIKTNIVNSIVAKDETAKAEFAKKFDKMAKTTAPDAASQIIKAIQDKKTRLLIGKDAKTIDLVVRLFPVKYQSMFKKLAGKK